MKTLLSVVIWMATVVGVGSIASAQQFNIDFGSHFTGLPSTYGAAAGQTGSWNDVISLGLTSGLVDLSGSPTDVDVTITSNNPAGNVNNQNSNDQILLTDFFFSTDGNAWSVEFANLDAGLYDVYVYAPRNTIVSTGDFTVNGVSVSDLPGAETMIEDISYTVVSGVIVSGAETLSLLSTSTVGNRGLSGIQLVSVVPEPSSLALFSAGALGLLGYGRQRRKKTA